MKIIAYKTKTHNHNISEYLLNILLFLLYITIQKEYVCVYDDFYEFKYVFMKGFEYKS